MVQFDKAAAHEGLFTELDVYDTGIDDPELAIYRPSRIRGQVVDRLTYTARALARHRLEQWRTRQRIGPHALSFVYVDRRAPDQMEGELRLATRIFLDESDDDHLLDAVNPEADGVPELLLVRILGALQELGHDYRRTTGFDPRQQMCQRVEDMQADADYLGIAATSVTFPNGPGAEPTILGIIVLNDDTRMLLQGGYGLDSPRVQSTHTLDIGGLLLQSRRWKWARDGQFEDASQGVQMALPALLALHKLIGESHTRGEVRGGRTRRHRQLTAPQG